MALQIVIGDTKTGVIVILRINPLLETDKNGYARYCQTQNSLPGDTFHER